MANLVDEDRGLELRERRELSVGLDRYLARYGQIKTSCSVCNM